MVKTIDLSTKPHKYLNPLVGKSLIEQTFTSEGILLESFKVLFATYCRQNDVDVLFKIYDTKRNILFTKTVNAKEFNDNEYYICETNLELKQGTRYVLGISIITDYDNNITCGCGSPTHKEKFIINNIEQKGSQLTCGFKYTDQIFIEAKTSFKDYKNNKGLISIIIPTYNSSKYLVNTLKSIKNQIYNNIEVIVVDDGSKDSLSVYETITKSKLDITFIRLNKNMGPCYARNKGIEIASGEYIFCCDSDIILNKDCLLKMLQKLHMNPSATWCYCNFFVGNELKQFYEYDKNIFNKKNCSSTMSLVKAKVKGRYDTSIKRLQDWDFFMSLAERGYKGVWINETLFKAIDRDGITKNNHTLSYDRALSILKLKHKDM